MKNLLLIGSLSFLFSIGLISYLKKVKPLSHEEITYIKGKLMAIPHIQPSAHSVFAKALNFEEQTTLIVRVQYLLKQPLAKSNSFTSKKTPIEQSALLEKSLNSLGFTTRKIRLYQTKEDQKDFTYEILEVETQEGWLMVDKYQTWIGLSRNYCPVSLKKLERSQFRMDWLFPFPNENLINLAKPFRY